MKRGSQFTSLIIGDDQPYLDRDPWAVAGVELGGIKTLLIIPLLKAGEIIGEIGVYRQEVRAFTNKQIELLENFAKQAVIAIENTRLLNELRDRTTQLGRSVEELRALGDVSQAVNSTLDLKTVLDTIVAKAVQLSGTEAGTIYEFDEHQRDLLFRSTYGMERFGYSGAQRSSYRNQRADNRSSCSKSCADPDFGRSRNSDDASTGHRLASWLSRPARRSTARARPRRGCTGSTP